MPMHISLWMMHSIDTDEIICYKDLGVSHDRLFNERIGLKHLG